MTADERAELASLDGQLRENRELGKALAGRMETLTERINALIVFQARTEEREAARQRACDEHNQNNAAAWDVIRKTQEAQLITSQQVAALLESRATAGVVVGKAAALVCAAVLSVLSTVGGWVLHVLLATGGGGPHK